MPTAAKFLMLREETGELLGRLSFLLSLGSGLTTPLAGWESQRVICKGGQKPLRESLLVFRPDLRAALFP